MPLDRDGSDARLLAALCSQIAAGADYDGWSFAFRPQLDLGEETIVPDVAGWRNAVFGAPDWVCDVAPHGETKAYARHRIASVWRIDAELRTINVLQRAGSGWFYNSYDGWLRAAPFEQVEIDVRAIWGDRIAI